MEIFWNEQISQTSFSKFFFLQNFHGWNILFSRMLHIAFAVVTGAKKVHRLVTKLVNLQDFLIGSTQQVKSMDSLFTTHLLSICAAWWNGINLKSARKKENKWLI